MSEYSKKLEHELNKRIFKSKNPLEEDSFIDFEMIRSVAVSGIVHIVILYSIWLIIITVYKDLYNDILSKIHSKYPKDLIFNLETLPKDFNKLKDKKYLHN